MPPLVRELVARMEFEDPALVARRASDHGHIDGILVDRVAAEDRELRSVELPGDRTLLDRLLTRSTGRERGASSRKPGRRCGGTPGRCRGRVGRAPRS